MDASTFLGFVRLVVEGDVSRVSGRLREEPRLARFALPERVGLPGEMEPFFLKIRHYIYGGDTALHMAAAAFSRPMAKLLVSYGADCRAKNRRGAEPLHYAADANWSRPRAQAGVIKYLLSIGADPNAVDQSGVAPLHRAVRTRSLSAVLTLLDGGAGPRQPNKSGSTPLHLAVQTTGRSGSGSDEARRQQAGIVKLLLEHGAKPTDQDLRGKQVIQAASSPWIRTLLAGSRSG